MKSAITILAVAVLLTAMIGFFTACDDGSGGGSNNNNDGGDDPGDTTHEHAWSGWVLTTAPTCTTEGEETRVCSLDGTIEKRTVDIDPDAHDYEWVATTSASFIEEYEATGTCKHNSAHTVGPLNLGPRPITNTEEWATAIEQISGKGNAGGYTLTIEGDVGVAGRTTASFGATAVGSSLTVTLKGAGKLYLTGQGNLINIDARQTLVIDSEDLTLQGLTNGVDGATQDNTSSVVFVSNYGYLTMKDGKISGNTSSTAGGGVYVNNFGTFTMEGGEISGNTVNGSTYGGGVAVYSNATFTMEGGKISGNAVTGTQLSRGGGVYVYGTTFTMIDGEISGNTTTGSGGGVSVVTPSATSTGTFIMQGGKISNNTAKNANVVSGGGVHLDTSTNFTMMNDAEISGNTAQNRGGGVYVGTFATFNMKGGKISDNSTASTTGDGGGGVYVNGSTSGGENVYGTFRISDGTIYGADADVSLRNRSGYGNTAALFGPGQRGTFTGPGGEWVQIEDALASTNNTIKVQNGLIVP